MRFFFQILPLTRAKKQLQSSGLQRISWLLLENSAIFTTSTEKHIK